MSLLSLSNPHFVTLYWPSLSLIYILSLQDLSSLAIYSLNLLLNYRNPQLILSNLWIPYLTSCILVYFTDSISQSSSPAKCAIYLIMAKCAHDNWVPETFFGQDLLANEACSSTESAYERIQKKSINAYKRHTFLTKTKNKHIKSPIFFNKFFVVTYRSQERW